MKTVVLTDGDLIAHQNEEGVEIIHRVVAVEPATKVVSIQQINTEGPIHTMPFSMIVSGLKAQVFGLYIRDAVSKA